MKTVRIYKNNLRENILRSLFFSNNVIFFGVGLAVAILIFLVFKFVFHSFQLGPFIMSVFVTEVCLALITIIQVDNQPIVSMIPRALLFMVSRKQYGMKDLDKTTSDFAVVGSYIKHKKQLIAVYEIQPYDIALLNEEDREQFYHQIKMMLHTLPRKLQLVVRKEIAKIKDYQKHFFSIYKQAHKKREQLIFNYIEDISHLVETERFQIMKYYAVFSSPLHPSSKDAFEKAAKDLHDQGMRFSVALNATNIHVQQLQNDELVAYCKSQLQ